MSKACTQTIYGQAQHHLAKFWDLQQSTSAVERVAYKIQPWTWNTGEMLCLQKYEGTLHWEMEYLFSAHFTWFVGSSVVAMLATSSNCLHAGPLWGGHAGIWILASTWCASYYMDLNLPWMPPWLCIAGMKWELYLACHVFDNAMPYCMLCRIVCGLGLMSWNIKLLSATLFCSVDMHQSLYEVGQMPSEQDIGFKF